MDWREQLHSTKTADAILHNSSDLGSEVTREGVGCSLNGRYNQRVERSVWRWHRSSCYSGFQADMEAFLCGWHLTDSLPRLVSTLVASSTSQACWWKIKKKTILKTQNGYWQKRFNGGKKEREREREVERKNLKQNREAVHLHATLKAEDSINSEEKPWTRGQQNEDAKQCQLEIRETWWHKINSLIYFTVVEELECYATNGDAVLTRITANAKVMVPMCNTLKSIIKQRNFYQTFR